MRRIERFIRKSGSRSYRSIILIASEGMVTEPLYFRAIQELAGNVEIRCVTASKQSSPHYILKRMRNSLKELSTFSGKDSAWIVADRDKWTENQLRTLYEWEADAKNHGVAISNPAFECWLLLHFEEKNSDSHAKCTERLRRHLPDYDKKFDPALITMNSVHTAYTRAKNSDNPPCERYPEIPGRSTVYRLIKDIFEWQT